MDRREAEITEHIKYALELELLRLEDEDESDEDTVTFSRELVMQAFDAALHN